MPSPPPAPHLPPPERSISRKPTRLLIVVLALALAGLAWFGHGRQVPEGPVGLFTSLPLVWGESADIGAELRGDSEPVWVLGELGQSGHGTVVPLDTLDPAKLRGLHKLVIAQSRALSPPENVALDNWVRAGGHLLLFTDPLLTEPSRFPLGDPRRPQAVAMLSPILARWGLELQFDDTQPEGDRQVDVLGTTLPVDMPGRFRQTAGSSCKLEAEGLLARCSVGAGQVLALADAQVLAREPRGPESRTALRKLIASAFATR